MPPTTATIREHIREVVSDLRTGNVSQGRFARFHEALSGTEEEESADTDITMAVTYTFFDALGSLPNGAILTPDLLESLVEAASHASCVWGVLIGYEMHRRGYEL